MSLQKKETKTNPSLVKENLGFEDEPRAWANNWDPSGLESAQTPQNQKPKSR